MDTLDTILAIKNSPRFSCEKCDFICSKKGDYKRHVLTMKHKRIHTDTNAHQENAKSVFACDCGKKYCYSQGLSKHKKNCKKGSQQGSSLLNATPEMIMEIVKQNQEFKELLIEQNKENVKLQQQLLAMAKEGKTINNTTNNKFNLQFFLNEQCKDALNLMDFVNTMKLKLSDLDTVGQLGYSEGISKIFIRNLKELDVFKRPIHCSDLKRETLYVKDQNAWEKENEENAKIRMAIKQVANKNIKQIPVWVQENPKSNDIESKKHMDYLYIVNQSMGGKTKEQDESLENKIIKSIAKEVFIEKKSETNC